MVQIDSAKSVFDFEAPCDGLVIRRYHLEGETLPALTDLAVVCEHATDWEAARKLLLQARANYTKREYNPFDVMHMSATKEDRWSERFGGAVPSDAQLAYLSSRKVDVPQGLTKAKASVLIGNLKMREAKGLANYNQTKKLESYGIPAINLSYKKACDLMWEIQRANGKRPDQRIVDGILNREREAGEDG